MLYTNEDIIKLYTLGIPDVDYKIEADKSITWLTKDVEDQWQSIAWSWPNSKKIDPLFIHKKYISIEKKKETYISPANGFVFDSKDVADEAAMCEALVDKYDKVLLSGYLNPDEALPLFLADLEEAGIDKVIAEKQKQLDRWLKEY